VDNMDENQECSNEHAEVEKALKKSNNAGQHFVLTNTKTRAKSMKLSGNANKKQN